MLPTDPLFGPSEFPSPGLTPQQVLDELGRLQTQLKAIREQRVRNLLKLQRIRERFAQLLGKEAPSRKRYWFLLASPSAPTHIGLLNTHSLEAALDALVRKGAGN